MNPHLLGPDNSTRVFRSLHTRILTGFLVVAALPVATVAVLNRWIDERATLEDACTALAEDALVVRNHVDDHLRFHRIAVSVLARSVAREELNDSASVTRLLRLTDDVYPGLSELSAFDSTGKLLATTRKGAWLPNGSSWGVSRIVQASESREEGKRICNFQISFYEGERGRVRTGMGRKR